MTAAATNAFGFVSDALSEYAETKGNTALQGVFQWAGNASESFSVYLDDHPIQAATAMTVGMLAVAAVFLFGEVSDDGHDVVSFWLKEAALCSLAYGAEKAGGRERVIGFCLARNRPKGEGKIRH